MERPQPSLLAGAVASEHQHMVEVAHHPAAGAEDGAERQPGRDNAGAGKDHNGCDEALGHDITWRRRIGPNAH